MVIPLQYLLLWGIVIAILGWFFFLFVIPDEFKNSSFYIYEELIWNSDCIDGDCTESVQCFWQDGHFCYIDPANL